MKNIAANLIDNTLTVSKTFYKKASVCGSAEYYELRQAMIENPGFKIVFKSIEKKTYNGLTFAVMKAWGAKFRSMIQNTLKGSGIALMLNFAEPPLPATVYSIP